MPQRQIVPGALTRIFTAADLDRPALGERYEDPTTGNEYIFLEGVASTVAGDPVIFDEAGATTRLAGSGVGAVAIAMAAIVADCFGWYQIYGHGSAKVVATGGVRVYGSTVTGQLTATVVTGALIHGLYTASGNGNTVTGSLTAVELSYPRVDRASGSY
jgi:hypothetical protein